MQMKQIIPFVVFWGIPWNNVLSVEDFKYTLLRKERGVFHRSSNFVDCKTPDEKCRMMDCLRACVNMEICHSFSHNTGSGECMVNSNASAVSETNSTWNTYVNRNASSRQQLPPCPSPFTLYTVQQYTHLCLWFQDMLLQHVDAESLCQDMDSYTVIVDTMDVWNLLKQQLAERGIDNRIWVGAKRQADDEFYWNDGRHFPKDDVMWKPNGVQAGEDCIEVKPSGGLLTSQPCSYKSAVVCQYHG